MAKAILFVNLKKEDAQTLADKIIAELGKKDIEGRIFTSDEKQDFKAADAYSVSFSLGGDGTVLYTARAMAPLGVPIFPINLGTLGFIAAVHPEEWERIFSGWRAGKVKPSRRLMLETRVERAGREVFRGCCLNDTVISASGIAKVIRLRVSAGGESFALAEEAPAGDTSAVAVESFMPLGQYRSDGLIVATPTGSTAYSVAAGGPILDPELEAISLNPSCAITLSQRPMVLPAGETILVEVEEGQRSGVLLTMDGQVTEPLEPGDKVFISRAENPALLIASDRKVFYTALKTKLAWMGMPGVSNA
jgi:NAD+ kinase